LPYAGTPCRAARFCAARLEQACRHARQSGGSLRSAAKPARHRRRARTRHRRIRRKREFKTWPPRRSAVSSPVMEQRPIAPKSFSTARQQHQDARDGVASTLIGAPIRCRRHCHRRSRRRHGCPHPRHRAAGKWLALHRHGIRPGIVSEMHRTDTIDYIVMLSGEIDMDMDEGSVTLARRRHYGSARHQSRLGQSQHGAGAACHRADGRQAARHRPSTAARPAGALIKADTAASIVTRAGLSAAASAGSLAQSQKAGITVVACVARTSAMVSDIADARSSAWFGGPPLISRSAGVVGLMCR